jgi:PadR family transcriptional regulator, regulatory protein PadR
MKTYLDDFEELVLLTIASLADAAYGVSIKEFIEKNLGRSISIGTLHSTIASLEERRLLTSYMGEPTQERGGRRKRFYELTKSGKVALLEMKSFRDQLWVSAKPHVTLSK